MIGNRQQFKEIFCKSILDQDTALLRTLFRNPLCSTSLRNLLDAIVFDDYTALQWCCLHGHIELARVLIDHGAEIGSIGKYKWTALHAASSSGQYDTVKLLLTSCANPLTEDIHGCLPVSLTKDKKTQAVLLKAMRLCGTDAARFVDSYDPERMALQCKCKGITNSNPSPGPSRLSTISVDSALGSESEDDEGSLLTETKTESADNGTYSYSAERPRSRSVGNILSHTFTENGKQTSEIDLETELSSRDSGVYLDPEDNENIFETYQKFDNNSNSNLKRWQNYSDLHTASCL